MRMRVLDYTAQINETGYPVLVMTIEVALAVDQIATPDDLRYVLENLIRDQVEKKK